MDLIDRFIQLFCDGAVFFWLGAMCGVWYMGRDGRK